MKEKISKDSRIEKDKKNFYERERYRTDPEFAIRRRAQKTKSYHKNKAKELSHEVL